MYIHVYFMCMHAALYEEQHVLYEVFTHAVLEGFHTEGGPWDLPPQQEFPPQDFENYDVIIASKQGIMVYMF